MRCVHLAFVLASLVASTGASLAIDLPVAEGTVRGEQLADGSLVFRGIPYAAPPVGKNRWRAPQPVAPWSGVRDATKPAATCIQHNEGWNADAAAKGKEDCLYLSLHAPKHSPGEKLPVFFWVHGGGNRAGTGYGDADSAIYHRGVVIVSIEYRLGVFGFLSHPELTAESPAHASGNYALMDIIAALRWVKANITQFGGDPDNVTVGGQSAGSTDVGLLLFSPPARGLFHKMVLESGPASLSLPARPLGDNEKIGLQFASLMNAHSLKDLRAAPAETVLTIGDKIPGPDRFDPSVLWIQTILDGDVLREAPHAMLEKGEHARVPMIIGDVTREFPFDAPPDALRAALNSFYGAKADEAMKLYGFKDGTPPPDDPVLGGVGTQMLADVIMRCPANLLARYQIAAGQQVWRYQFGLPRAGFPGPPAHNAELPYVFDAPPPNATFATWPPVQQYWANFARTGNPNGPGLPEWPSMTVESTYIAFTPDGPKLGKDLRGAYCRLMNP
jgi:para-nitrobenzyl esterase